MVSLNDYLTSIEAGLRAGRKRYESAISLVSQSKPSRYCLESRVLAEPQNHHPIESRFGSMAIAPTPQQIQRPTGARRPNSANDELFESKKFVKRTLDPSPGLQQVSVSTKQSDQRWQPLPYALAGRIGGTPRELSQQLQREFSENRKWYQANGDSSYGYTPVETVAPQPRQPSHALAQAYPKPKGSRPGGKPTDVYVLLAEMCGRDEKVADYSHHMPPVRSAQATSTTRGKRRMPVMPDRSGASRRPSSSSHPGIVMSAAAAAAAEEVETSGWKPVLYDLTSIREFGTRDHTTLQPTPDAGAGSSQTQAQFAHSSAGTRLSVPGTADSRTSGQQYFYSGSPNGSSDAAIVQEAEAGAVQRSWSASDLQVNSRTARDAVVRALSSTLWKAARQQRFRADGSSQWEFSHVRKGLSTTARPGSQRSTRLGWQKAPQRRHHGDHGIVSDIPEKNHAAHTDAASQLMARPQPHGAPEACTGSMSDLAAMGLVPLLPLIAGQKFPSYNHPSSVRPAIKRIRVVEQDEELAAGMGPGPAMVGPDASHHRENSPGPAPPRARTLLSESQIGGVSLRPMGSDSADLERTQAVSRPRVPTAVRQPLQLQAASPPNAVTTIPSRSSTATKGASKGLIHSLGAPRTADLSPIGSAATVPYQQRQPVPPSSRSAAKETPSSRSAAKETPSSRSAAKEILDRRDRRDLHHRPRPPPDGKRRPSRLAQVASDTAPTTAALCSATLLPLSPPVSQTRLSSRPSPPSTTYGSAPPPPKAKRKPSLPPSGAEVPPPPKLKRKPSMPIVLDEPQERDGHPLAPPALKRKPTAPPGYLYIAAEESVATQMQHVLPASPATLTRTLRHADGRATPAQTSPSSTADVPSPLQLWMEEAPEQKYLASGGVKSTAATSRQSMAPPPPIKPAAPSRPSPTPEVHDGQGANTQDDRAAPTDDSEEDERVEDARKPFAAQANPQRRAMGGPRMSIRRLTPRASAMLQAGDGSQSPASPWTTGAGGELGDESFAWGELVRQNSIGSMHSGGEPLLDDGARAVVLHNMPFGSSGAEAPPMRGTRDAQKEPGRCLRGRSSWSEASQSSIVGSTASVMDANGLWQAPQDVWLHGGLDSDGSSESDYGD